MPLLDVITMLCTLTALGFFLGAAVFCDSPADPGFVPLIVVGSAFALLAVLIAFCGWIGLSSTAVAFGLGPVSLVIWALALIIDRPRIRTRK